MAKKKQKSQNTNDWINPFYEEKTVFYENDLQAAKDRVASILGKNYVSEGNGIGKGSFDAYPEGDRYKSFEYEGEKYDRIEVFYMPKSPTIRGYRVRLARFNPLNGYKLEDFYMREYTELRRNKKKISFSKVQIGDILFSVRDRTLCKVYKINKETILAQTNIYDAADNENLVFSVSDFSNELVLKSNTQELVEYLRKYGTTKRGKVAISPEDGVAFRYDRTTLNAKISPNYLAELFYNACFENKEIREQTTFNSFQFSFGIDRPKYNGLPYGKTHFLELIEEDVSDEGIFRYEDIKVGDTVEYDSTNFVVLEKEPRIMIKNKYGDIHYFGEKEARTGIFRKPKSLGALDRNVVSHASVKAGDVVYYIPEGRRCTVTYKDAATRIVKLKSEDGRTFFLLKSDFDNGDVASLSGAKSYDLGGGSGETMSEAEVCGIVNNNEFLGVDASEPYIQAVRKVANGRGKVFGVLQDDKQYGKNRIYFGVRLKIDRPLVIDLAEDPFPINHYGVETLREHNYDSMVGTKDGQVVWVLVLQGKAIKRITWRKTNKQMQMHLSGVENIAQIAANAYVQKARIDYEKSLTPEERKQLAAQRTNNLTKGAMLLIGAGIGFAAGKFI